LLASYLSDRFMLSDSQHGIQLGFNGMTVGGGDVSRSIQNWFVVELLPAAICSDRNVSS
jgi:hypothetical protein